MPTLTPQPEETLIQLEQHWHTACLMSSADDDLYFERVSIKLDTNPKATLLDDRMAVEATRPQSVSGPGGACFRILVV